MQFELALSEHPSAASLLWEQLAPSTRQAVIDRLAQAIAMAIAPSQQPEESADE